MIKLAPETPTGMQAIYPLWIDFHPEWTEWRYGADVILSTLDRRDTVADSKSSKSIISAQATGPVERKAQTHLMNAMTGHGKSDMGVPPAKADMLRILSFLEDFGAELEESFELFVPNPFFRMSLHLIRGHLDAKTVTPTSLIGASRVPYATANRRLREMVEAGLIGVGQEGEAGNTPEQDGLTEGRTGEGGDITAGICGCTVAGPRGWTEMPPNGRGSSPGVMHDHHLAAVGVWRESAVDRRKLPVFWSEAG